MYFSSPLHVLEVVLTETAHVFKIRRKNKLYLHVSIEQYLQIIVEPQTITEDKLSSSIVVTFP